MDAVGIIRRELERKHRALSEFSSKRVLACYGVPVVSEKLAGSEDDAAEMAESLGYPVVLKACSPELMHKSEGGLVRVGLADEASVREAYRQIVGRTSGELEGVLVQAMISGQRELVVGLIRDAQFGPCVMVGLGGVLAEVLGDTAFRMAPVDMFEALDMVEELRCRAMLGTFRGQAAADLEAVGRCLIGLGEVGLAHEEVAEIDVNPLIIDSRGRVTAVDALVVLAGGRADA